MMNSTHTWLYIVARDSVAVFFWLYGLEIKQKHILVSQKQRCQGLLFAFWDLLMKPEECLDL